MARRAVRVCRYVVIRSERNEGERHGNTGLRASVSLRDARSGPSYSPVSSRVNRSAPFTLCRTDATRVGGPNESLLSVIRSAPNTSCPRCRGLERSAVS